MKYEVLENWGEANTTGKGAVCTRSTPDKILADEKVPEKDREGRNVVRDQDQEDPGFETVPENGPHFRILLPPRNLLQ